MKDIDCKWADRFRWCKYPRRLRVWGLWRPKCVGPDICALYEQKPDKPKMKGKIISE